MDPPAKDRGTAAAPHRNPPNLAPRPEQPELNNRLRPRDTARRIPPTPASFESQPLIPHVPRKTKAFQDTPLRPIKGIGFCVIPCFLTSRYAVSAREVSAVPSRGHFEPQWQRETPWLYTGQFIQPGRAAAPRRACRGRGLSRRQARPDNDNHAECRQVLWLGSQLSVTVEK